MSMQKFSNYNFAPDMGRVPVDKLVADTVGPVMLFLTKVRGHALPECLAVGDPALARIIEKTIAGKGRADPFTGEKGSAKVVKVPQLNSTEQPERYVYLAGLGGPEDFGQEVVCQAFNGFIKTALRRRCERVVIPFVANRMTDDTMNLKSLAFLLRREVDRTLAAWKKPIALREIIIYCTPQAKRYLKKGLSIEHSVPSQTTFNFFGRF